MGLGAVHSDRYYYGWGGRKSLEEARASFEKALQLKPASMRARRGLCWSIFLTGRSEGCLVQAREAAQFGRADEVETILTRAHGYTSGGLRERVPPLYRRAIEFIQLMKKPTPTSSSLRGERSSRLTSATRFFAGSVTTKKFTALSPMPIRSWENYELAREHYEKAMADSHLDTFLFGGILCERLGDTDRARQAWRKGIALIEPKLEAYPDNTRMRLLLACFYGFLG